MPWEVAADPLPHAGGAPQGPRAQLGVLSTTAGAVRKGYGRCRWPAKAGGSEPTCVQGAPSIVQPPPSRHRCRCAHHFKAAFICLALYFRRRELERALERALVRSSLSWEHLTQESGRGPAVGRGGGHTRAPRGCWVPVLRLCPSSPVVFWGPPVPRGHPGGGMLQLWGNYAMQGVCGGVTSHPQCGCGDGESGDCTSPAGDGPVPAASTRTTASPCGLGATGGVSHPHPQPFPPPMEISLGCRAPAARAVRVLAV